MVLRYLGFYTKALNGKFKNLVYIDAFAGTGSREHDEGGETCSTEGSALLALDIEPPFSKYFFIEMDQKKALELTRKLASKSERETSVIVGDANINVRNILTRWDKYTSRGVVFLDPFAMSVEWATLEAIAKTESLDLWFLFPFNAVARTLPLNGEIPDSWREKLINIFGEDPTDNLYTTNTYPSLFPEEVNESTTYRQSGLKPLGRYIIKRMQSIFHGHVANQALVLKNSNNSALFLLLFCSANPHPTASSLAKKVVDDILKRHASGGGHVQGFCD